MGTCCSKKEQRKQPDMDTIARSSTNRSGEQSKFKRPDTSKTNLISDYQGINQKSKDIVFGYIYKKQCKLFNRTSSPYYIIQPNIYYITLKYYYLDDKDDLNHVELSELSIFILKKVNNKTIDRLWKHLRDDNNQVTKKDVLPTLQFTAVLYIAYRYRVCVIFI